MTSVTIARSLTMITTDSEEDNTEISVSNDSNFSIIKNDLLVKKEEIRLQVICTVYNPVAEQCSGNPLITADGSKISLSGLNNGSVRWIAVSRDLLKEHNFKFGDKVKLTCPDEPKINGVWEIHDTMHQRWRKKIDLLQPKGGLYGKWNTVMIEKV